ncbi:unnamed protein product [Cyprideis torosa]|uniref:Uncharacterized protein n=1 Tax=Cyprideis torosa TaxID=163714 RepID=A0A7R8WHB2_9CRUS|nr:unnamed protein product [Cyprideis torosa]CAG0899133.1 unnamed protein product [Cyprideis torosa]
MNRLLGARQIKRDVLRNLAQDQELEFLNLGSLGESYHFLGPFFQYGQRCWSDEQCHRFLPNTVCEDFQCVCREQYEWDAKTKACLGCYEDEVLNTELGFCYFAGTNQLTWDAAQEACEARNKNLVSIQSRAEEDFINDSTLVLMNLSGLMEHQWTTETGYPTKMMEQVEINCALGWILVKMANGETLHAVKRMSSPAKEVM